MKAGQHKQKKPGGGGRHKRLTNAKPRKSMKDGKNKQVAAATGMKRKEPEAPMTASLGAQGSLGTLCWTLLAVF